MDRDKRVGKEKIKILMHTEPNITSFNAQDLNGRYIASLLDKDFFEIYFMDTLGTQIDPKLQKDNIKILKIDTDNKILRKIRAFKYKLLYRYDVSFYVRVFRVDSLFLKLLPFFDKNRKTIHMVESLVPYLGDKEYNKWAKYNALHSTKTFSISKKVQARVEEHYGIDTSIIHVGVDCSIFKPLQKNGKERLRVVGCGALNPMKQPLLFIKIAKKFPEADFVWVGEGILRDEIVKKSDNIDNFELKNNMAHKELSEYFAQSDIFLFPSLHEGFPKVVIESMACRLPSIVFDRYEPEAVIDNQTGFIVSDENEMIDRLRILIKDKNIREEFSNNSVKRAKEFDWKLIVKEWDKIIKDLVNENYRG